MGNSCCRGEAALSAMLPQKGNSYKSNTRKESLLGDRNYKEVKIKITKKQLEELIRKADQVHGMSVDQLLASSFTINGPNNGSSHHFDGESIRHQRSWRPVLQTIPEVN